MNIDEYRAMKAQESTQTPPEQPAEVPVSTPEVPASTTPEPTPTETTPTPTTFKVGDKEYTPDQIAELEKGYLRQSDYTKKTQEVAAQRREVERAQQILQAVQTNPELSQALVNTVPSLNPHTMQVEELQAKLWDAQVQNEVLTLQQKYPDFDAQVALKTAVDHKLNSLEDAYLLEKARTPQTTPAIDVNALREQLKAELKAELAPAPDTSSIIATNNSSAPIQSQEPRLTPQQIQAAQKFGVKPEEYAKWMGRK